MRSGDPHRTLFQPEWQQAVFVFLTSTHVDVPLVSEFYAEITMTHGSREPAKQRSYEPVHVIVRDLQLFLVRHCYRQEVGFGCKWQRGTTDKIETNQRKSWTCPKANG